MCTALCVWSWPELGTLNGSSRPPCRSSGNYYLYALYDLHDLYDMYDLYDLYEKMRPDRRGEFPEHETAVYYLFIVPQQIVGRYRA